MIVDDDPMILKYCDAILSAQGHEVITCTNGDNALDILQTHNLSLLIVDVVMPMMNGFELLKRVKMMRHIDAPVLMLTGRRSPKDVQTALELGALDYIIKPVDKDVLLSKLNFALGKHAPPVEVKFATGIANFETEIILPSRIMNVSEMGMMVQTSTYIDRNLRLKLATALFEEIGMQCPPLRTGICRPISADAVFRYEVFVSFIGLDEPAMQKIRRWITAQTLSLRKTG